MKFLKIFILALIPTLLVVGCRKADTKPKGCVSHETESSSVVTPQSNDLILSSSSNNEPESSSNGGVKSVSDIYGTGDDDRDGGDKKTKKR